MDVNIITAIFSAITSLFVAFLTFFILKFEAKPKLRIHILNGKKRIRFRVNEKTILKFYLDNVGHWFSAKPAATNIILWVNFEDAFNPIELRYGAELEKTTRDIRTSKIGKNKWIKASGIHLFYEETGETIEVEVQMPKKKGNYKIWLAVHADQGTCGVYKFRINVTDS